MPTRPLSCARSEDTRSKEPCDARHEQTLDDPRLGRPARHDRAAATPPAAPNRASTPATTPRRPRPRRRGRRPPATPATTAAGIAPTPRKAFNLPFDVTVPGWLDATPSVEQPNFVTWQSPTVDRAVRFLIPVNVYPPGGTGPTSPPPDYLHYLLAQTDHGAHFADQTQTTVGGKPATIVTATVDNSLDGSLGCPDKRHPGGRLLRPPTRPRAAHRRGRHRDHTPAHLAANEAAAAPT